MIRNVAMFMVGVALSCVGIILMYTLPSGAIYSSIWLSFVTLGSILLLKSKEIK